MCGVVCACRAIDAPSGRVAPGDEVFHVDVYFLNGKPFPSQFLEHAYGLKKPFRVSRFQYINVIGHIPQPLPLFRPEPRDPESCYGGFHWWTDVCYALLLRERV